MFYLKILLTQLDWRWTLVAQEENMYMGSVDKITPINDYGGIVGYSRIIRHGKFKRVWERSV
tara:strand:+ start:91 stop:276 length:186 start_codon:yes stop_codon:yes gene_type:complete